MLYLWFDLRRARRALEKVNVGYRREIARLRKAHNFAEITRVREQWNAERDVYDQELDAIRTRRFLKKARILDVPIPEYSPMPDGSGVDANGYWYVNVTEFDPALTRRGRALLKDTIRKEQRERHEARIRWIAPLTALTGMIGTLIGLVSIFGNLVLRWFHH